MTDDIRLTIFDCDGVLVDSEFVGLQIEAELLQSAGLSIGIDELAERFSGMGWKQILQEIERSSGLSLVDRLHDKAEAILDQRLSAEVRAIDGVKEVLEQLRFPRCVCSNTKRSRVSAMLEKTGLAGFFQPNIFSAKDLGEDRGKPRPDIFLHGAEKMGVPPANAVVIEDSIHGVHAAKQAGMFVIGFTGGSHTFPAHAANLRAAGADRTISSIGELPAILSGTA